MTNATQMPRRACLAAIKTNSMHVGVRDFAGLGLPCNLRRASLRAVTSAALRVSVRRRNGTRRWPRHAASRVTPDVPALLEGGAAAAPRPMARITFELPMPEARLIQPSFDGHFSSTFWRHGRAGPYEFGQRAAARCRLGVRIGLLLTPEVSSPLLRVVVKQWPDARGEVAAPGGTRDHLQSLSPVPRRRPHGSRFRLPLRVAQHFVDVFLRSMARAKAFAHSMRAGRRPSADLLCC